MAVHYYMCIPGSPLEQRYSFALLQYNVTKLLRDQLKQDTIATQEWNEKKMSTKAMSIFSNMIIISFSTSNYYCRMDCQSVRIVLEILTL